MNHLKINEIYRSLQGESSFTGIPFALVRLTGCKLRCTYCDTAYAFFEGSSMTLADIVTAIDQLKVEHVLLTGGEPLDQPAVKDLIDLLLPRYTVLVETGGYHSIAAMPRKARYIVDIKTPSSKMHLRNCPSIPNEVLSHDEIKFVIGDESDYLFAKNTVRQYDLSRRCTVLFSPVYEKMEYQRLAEWILQDHLNVRFQIQLHKHIWPSSKRGV